MKLLLPKLTERLSKYQEVASRIPVPHYKLDVPKESDDQISHAYFWPRVGKFFRKQDIIVAETGESIPVYCPSNCRVNYVFRYFELWSYGRPNA
jgi:TPP-dependent 2-oxoacid decarboxylase